MKVKPNISALKIKLKNKKDRAFEFKMLRNKLLVQERDDTNLTRKSLKIVTKKKPTNKNIDDMIFAFNISRYVKSNSIVMVKNQRTLAIGAGQKSRIDSTKKARQKAKKEKNH